MRMIGMLLDAPSAERLTAYLERCGIATRMEGEFDAPTGHTNYHIWIQDEDQIPQAQAIYERFLKEPTNAEFDVPLFDQPPPQATPATPARTHFTNFMLALCCFFFVLNYLEQRALIEKGFGEAGTVLTPLQATCLYDLPQPIAQLQAIVLQYKLKPNQPIPKEAFEQLAAIEKIPFWRGAYLWAVEKIKGSDTTLDEGPLFEKIRQGEVWRLFSPILLHGDLLHILFNMIWLWVLGRPIEQRIGFGKTALLTLLSAIGSNTAQYLMSGFLFLGYSGVVMGLAGFIWMREREAPWEGYPIQKANFWFLAIFIGAILALQVAGLVIDLVFNKQFTLPIANTAHIVGALIGVALGKRAFFAQRVHV